MTEILKVPFNRSYRDIFRIHK